MNKNIMFFLILIVFTYSNIYAQLFDSREPSQNKSIESIISRITKSINHDNKHEVKLENLVKGIELVYAFPDFAYPTVSFVRSRFNNYIYDEVKDSSLTIITDHNKDILSKRYWRDTFINWDINPLKIIMRVINFKKKKNLVIANYGTSNDLRTDLVLFEITGNILKPLLIYPKAKDYGLYSYPNIEILLKDTVRIGYKSGDAEDIWQNYNYFLINKYNFIFIKNVNTSGWSLQDSIGNFTVMKIYTTFYNKNGSLKKKQFDCYARYDNGKLKYYDTKTDKVTLYHINPNNPYYITKKYKVVSIKDKRMPMNGPIEGNAMPTIWNNKKYMIHINELKLK